MGSDKGKKGKVKAPKPVPLKDGWALRVVRGPNEEGLYYWRAQKSVDGKQVSAKGLAGWDHAVPDEMRQAFNLRREAGTLEDASTENTAVKTVSELLDAYLAFRVSGGGRKKLATKSVLIYRQAVDRIKEGLGSVKLSEVSRSRLDSYRVWERSRFSDHTINSNHQTLNAAWLWGFERNLVNARSLKLEMVTKDVLTVARTKHYPSDSEMDTLMEDIRTSGVEEPWVVVALEIAKNTGARVGEIANLSWDMVDFSHRTISLVGKKPEPRTIPLSKPLSEVLRAWKVVQPAGKNLLNISDSSAKHRINLALQSAAERTGLQHRFTTHSVRRWFVNHMKRRGIDVKTAAHIAGHTPAVMLSLYSETSPEDLENAFASLFPEDDTEEEPDQSDE